MSEHCIRIDFPYHDSNLDAVFSLEDACIDALTEHQAGECDGNEVGAGEASIFLYGSDADTIMRAILPILRTSALVHQGWVVKRYGPPIEGVRQERIAGHTFRDE